MFINTLRAISRTNGKLGRRLALLSIFSAAGLAVSGAVQAFPSLGLVPGTPDISSPAQIDVAYSYDGGTGIGTLTAFGGVSQLNLPPSQAVAGGLFSLTATLDVLNTTVVSGSVTINGTSPGFTDPLLLSASLSQFGAGANDPLEFVFDTLGGSTAALFGSTAGIILTNTGFSGDLTRNFGTGGGFGASADAFGMATAVPAPGTLLLVLLALVPMVHRCRSESPA
jgi:hypothetical protein